jgi:hypothetical protein
LCANLDGLLLHLNLGVLGLNSNVLHDHAGDLDGPGVGLHVGAGLLNHLGLHDSLVDGHHAGASDLLDGPASVADTEIAGASRGGRGLELGVSCGAGDRTRTSSGSPGASRRYEFLQDFPLQSSTPLFIGIDLDAGR